MELKKEPFSIERVICDVIESLNSWANVKAITLEKNLAENTPQVSIDPMRLGQSPYQSDR